MNRMAFHLTARLLPAYKHCRWGNKVKNAFAKNAFSHVGEAVNWGKNVLISADFVIGDFSGVGDNARIPKGVTIGNDVIITAGCCHIGEGSILATGLLSQKMLNPIAWLVVTRQKSSAIENEYMLNKRIFLFCRTGKICSNDSWGSRKVC